MKPIKWPFSLSGKEVSFKEMTILGLSTSYKNTLNNVRFPFMLVYMKKRKKEKTSDYSSLLSLYWGGSTHSFRAGGSLFCMQSDIGLISMPQVLISSWMTSVVVILFIWLSAFPHCGKLAELGAILGTHPCNTIPPSLMDLALDV